MKANELTSKDLMDGDWVQMNNGPAIVTKERDILFKDKFGKGIAPTCNPIPLTPEILEKNGWKPYVPENHLETVYACQDISKAVADELYALWPYQDGSFYLLLRVDGKDMVRMDVHYVHQLQHALRLCEIDKNIEL